MKLTPQLDLAKYTDTLLDIEGTLIERVLENSHGEPIMSDEDVKIALLSLLNTCKIQQTIIDELVIVVNDMRESKPKRKLKIPFKK